MTEWRKNDEPDAEYNSLVADVHGRRVEVFSDRDGKRWGYAIDGDTVTVRSHDSREGAQREAIRHAEESP